MRKFSIAPSYKRVAIALYLIVCLLFTVKYLMRVGVAATLLGSFVFLVGIGLVYLFSHRCSRWLLPIMIVYTLLAGILIPVCLPVGTFDVDRWDMIDAFSSTLFSGDYPYAAEGVTSGNNPAQSPFYFALCLPFWASKWYVGLPLAGLWIYYLATKKTYNFNSTSTFLLLCSPFLIYETLTCSTIFFNAALVAAWMLWIKYAPRRDCFFIVIHAIAGGLLLCTRNCFIIPVIILGVMMLRRLPHKGLVILWGVVVAITFCLLYLPFVYGWGVGTWDAVNPFKVQSEVILSTGLMVFLVVGALATGYFCRNFSQAMYYGGVWLFISCVLMMIETSLLVGFDTTFFQSRSDITYFILSMPFLMPFIDTSTKTLDNLDPIYDKE